MGRNGVAEGQSVLTALHDQWFGVSFSLEDVSFPFCKFAL